MFNPAPNDIRDGEISNYFNIGCGTCSPGHFNTNTFQFADDVSLIRGRHQIVFGVDLIRSQNNDTGGYLQNGDFQFNGSATGDRAGRLPARQHLSLQYQPSAAGRAAAMDSGTLYTGHVPRE